MKTRTHTPGPWRTNISRLSDNSINVAHVVGPDGQGLAQVGVYGEAETLSNAGLFAAAPDLLEALELLQGMDFRLDDEPHGREIRRRALKAIAAAKAGAQ